MEDPQRNNRTDPQPGEQSAPRGPIWARFPGTFFFIAITVTVFLAQIAASQLAGYDMLLEYGAKSRAEILSGEVWRLVTPIFLHVGIPHIFVNMYSLYAIGPAVERFFGTPRFMITYLQAGIAGIIFSLALSPYPSAGASGAIFGMLGALAAFLYRHRGLFGRFGRLQLRQIILVAFLNLGLGLMPGIDNWGHLGGLVAGGALSWWLGPRFEIVWVWTDQGQLKDRSSWEQSRTGYLVSAGVLSLLTIAALLLFAP
jgi:membrane associated rhomboid family serine protease